MTDQDQNIAIAEYLGWKWYRRPATGIWAKNPLRTLYHPLLHAEYIKTLSIADMTERECNHVFIMREGLIPSYTTDLNAMHEAEKTLKPDDFSKFISIISTLTYSENCFEVENHFRRIHATAPHRAESFLRALNLWKMI